MIKLTREEKSKMLYAITQLVLATASIEDEKTHDYFMSYARLLSSKTKEVKL